MLVLSAACRDPILSDFVDEGLLRILFEKTIYFLRQSATATSSLRIDMHILEGLQRDLYPDTESASRPPSVKTKLQPGKIPMGAPIAMPIQGQEHGQLIINGTTK